MIKKLFLIIFLLGSYVYLVSTDPEGSMLGKAQNFYSYCQHKYKGMNLKYEVNKWPNEVKTPIKTPVKNQKNPRKQRNF
ncbi:MAG: hypothetical protein K1060chlam5_01262 [Candidatus Anoxychlamydiales bacterium]|nr:hypothetical protein [Candidatus Anoxychlamydiales bacterium]